MITRNLQGTSDGNVRRDLLWGKLKKFSAVLGFLVVFSLVLFSHAHAHDFQTEIIPSEINPGDAFIIRVQGTSSEITSALLRGQTFQFSSCGDGCFIAVGALAIDTKPARYTVKIFTREGKKDLKLTVKPKQFPEISLTLSEEKVMLSPENLKRAQKENEKLTSLWMKVSKRLWKGKFILPLENSFSTLFGTKRIMNEKKTSVHRGLDIRGKKGEEVRASNRGKVVLTEELFFGGNTIILDHGMGIYSIYMHLSGFHARPDDIVEKGDVIGYVGSSGRASGPHLHFGIKVSSISTNPASLLELEF
jgi:murein DD-endopeptidase MepM/ murein hydrolase activator NlpD